MSGSRLSSSNMPRTRRWSPSDCRSPDPKPYAVVKALSQLGKKSKQISVRKGHFISKVKDTPPSYGFLDIRILHAIHREAAGRRSCHRSVSSPRRTATFSECLARCPDHRLLDLICC